MENMDWYNSLIKPAFTPPSEAFAPAWIILYIMIGVSFFFFAKTGFSKAKIFPLILFFLQLAINLVWSTVFFNMQNIGLSAVLITALWVLLLATIIAFHKFSKIAAYLLIPYFLWVTYATYLNYGYYILNPAA